MCFIADWNHNIYVLHCWALCHHLTASLYSSRTRGAVILPFPLNDRGLDVPLPFISLLGWVLLRVIRVYVCVLPGGESLPSRHPADLGHSLSERRCDFYNKLWLREQRLCRPHPHCLGLWDHSQSLQPNLPCKISKEKKVGLITWGLAGIWN